MKIDGSSTIKKVTTLVYKSKQFAIVRFEDGYFAIDEEDISEDGKLLKEYNGITGCMSYEMEETIKLAKNSVDVEELVQDGMPLLEACIKVCMG